MSMAVFGRASAKNVGRIARHALLRRGGGARLGRGASGAGARCATLAALADAARKSQTKARIRPPSSETGATVLRRAGARQLNTRQVSEGFERLCAAGIWGRG